jgi:hypothetical protein
MPGDGLSGQLGAGYRHRADPRAGCGTREGSVTAGRILCEIDPVEIDVFDEGSRVVRAGVTVNGIPNRV